MKNCLSRSCVVLRTVFFLTVILLRFTTSAQETVVEPTSFKDNYSIIREINETESLIYNCYQGSSMFTLTVEGSTTAEMISQGYQLSHIRDFEILNGEDVYFCGDWYWWDAQYNQVLKSVYIGHFAMSPFRDTAWYHSVPVDTYITSPRV